MESSPLLRVESGFWGVYTDIHVYENDEGKRCFCFHFCDEWGLPSNSTNLQMLFQSDPHGGRFIIEGFRRDHEAAAILDTIKTEGMKYYSRLIDLSRQGDLSEEDLAMEVELFVSSCPIDRISSSSTSAMNFLKGFFVGYGLYEARSKLKESFSSLEDAEYIESMRTLVGIITGEAGLVSPVPALSFFNARGLSIRDIFTCAFYLSLGLKLSDVCAYNDMSVLDASNKRLAIENNIGAILSRMGIVAQPYCMRTLVSPGGGAGKSITCLLLDEIERMAGQEVYTLSHRDDLVKMRDDIWAGIDRDEDELDRTVDDDLRYELKLSIDERFSLYMRTLLPVIENEMLGFIDFVRGRPEGMRQRCVTCMDRMGFPCLLSIIARGRLNRILEENFVDVKCDLETKAAIRIPKSLLSLAENLILNNGYLDQILKLTGRPVIVLDIPVSEARQRSSRERAEVRSRHDKDRASLRLLGLCLRELFPQDVVVIPCAYGDKKYLSRIKVACRSIFDIAFLKMGNSARTELSWLYWVKRELEGLSSRLDIMAENLGQLQSIH